MSYIKAVDILPQEIIDIIQHYVDGEYIYVPRKESNRKTWGENTNTRDMLLQRNIEIYENYLDGMSVGQLSLKYHLSDKSIQKILAKQK